MLLSQQHRETYFSEMPASFGSGAQLTPARRVETTPKVGQPPHRGVAREAVTLSVDGVEQVLEVVRQKRRLGGQQGYWVCPRCGALTYTCSAACSRAGAATGSTTARVTFCIRL